MRLRYEQLGTWRPHETTSLRIEIPRHVYDRPLRTPRDHETWLRDASLRVRRAPGGPRDRDQNEPVKLQLYSDAKAMAKSINKPVLTYCNQSIPSSYKNPNRECYGNSISSKNQTVCKPKLDNIGLYLK